MSIVTSSRTNKKSSERWEDEAEEVKKEVEEDVMEEVDEETEGDFVTQRRDHTAWSHSRNYSTTYLTIIVTI